MAKGPNSRRCLSGLIGAALVSALALGMSGRVVAQTGGVVDDSRVVIPPVRVVRPAAVQTDTGAAQSPANATVEVQPLATLTPARPQQTGVQPAAADPATDAVRGPATNPATNPPTIPANSLPAGEGDTAAQPVTRSIRVLTPVEQDGTGTPDDAGEESGPRTAALDDGRNWQRERDRRFTVVPPSMQTDENEEDAKPVLVPLDSVDTALKEGARLRQLDKMTGQSVTFDIVVGARRRVDRLIVQLEACRSPEDNAAHGSMAFLKIWDTRREETQPDFTGWMFAESPALSALDHPRYDLWVISCTIFEG
ncbi:MAG: DUF2155 domain-containing protein [Pseudomonadota bacterium]